MAIKLRLASFGSDKGDLTLPISDGESLRHAAVRILGQIPINRSIADVFLFVVDGEFVDPNQWEHIILRETSDVLIVPRIEGGDNNAILRTLVVAVASFYLTPAIAGQLAGGLTTSTFAAGGLGNALVGATVLSVTSYLAFTAFPPPAIDLSNGSISGSQMYSISGQANQAKRLDIVPKVYGVHRIFPTVAAVPYTELVTDNNGKLVQDFYSIYDFGLGPVDISDIKIGDTPITDFENYEMNFVDLNKPEVSEGPWDDILIPNFVLYKGDVTPESLSIVLNKNATASPTPPQGEYQVIRNSILNSDGAPSEISLSFVCPTGLYSIGSNGYRGYATIDMDISYALVGTENWVPYNSDTDTLSYYSQGGDSRATSVPVSLPSASDIINVYGAIPIGGSVASISYLGGQATRTLTTGYSFPSYTSSFVATDINYNSTVYRNPVGRSFYINGMFIGKIVQFVSQSVSTGAYYLDRPIGRYITVAEKVDTTTYYANGNSSTVTTYQPAYMAVITQAVGNFRLSSNLVEAHYASVKFTPKQTGQFKVRITRNSTFSDYNYKVYSGLTLASIQTRLDRTPIFTDKRHTFLELRIRATGQLNGAISNLSGLAKSVIDVYDTNTGTWSKQYNANPAWVYADIFTGNINKRPIDKSRLHLPSLIAWAELCDEIPTSSTLLPYYSPRFRCNMVMDFVTTVQSLANDIASSAQASMNIIDGKYGVLIDELKTIPVQVFTPRNSNGFSSSKVFAAKPHALNVKYVDPTNDWQLTELVVYDDGYDETNATEFQDLNAFACTDPEQAFRFGRFTIAQSRLRQEVMTLEVDFENIVCTRGDYVVITQDIMKVGGFPARVSSISGNTITIDDAIETDGMSSYGYTFRSAVNGILTNTLTVVNSDTFILDGSPLPEVGDLIVIGIVGQITFDCIVKSITPSGDMSATLTLIEKADAIYNAESGAVIPGYNPGISQTSDSPLIPPPEVENLEVADNFWECTGSAYRYYIVLDWDPAIGAAYDSFEVYVDYGSGYDSVGITKSTIFDYTVSESNLGLVHNFKVIALSALGNGLDLGSVGSVSATPLYKVTPPSDVEELHIDITGEVLQLYWPAIADCDALEYLIRFSPNTNDSWGVSVPLLRVDRRTTLVATQARTGIYLVKAVDFNGNESVNAASAVTTIPELFNLNVITETTDFPALLGSKEQVVYDGAGLILDTYLNGGNGFYEYFPSGYYYYDNFVDLGDIYTCRIQSLIRSEGYAVDDIMSNWVLLSNVITMSTVGTSNWDVGTQYRTTSSFNVIADWVTLDAIDPISEGQQDLWTAWKKFVIGDVTGRIFQFRLKLISYQANTSPRVFDGTIRVDMPDRIDSYNNLTAPDTGYTVTYTPPFKGPGNSPAVQISMDNAATGDYWAFTSKTLDGFTIQFFDSSDTPISRIFDAQVKGYGRKNGSVI